jgi:hypothetical protein
MRVRHPPSAPPSPEVVEAIEEEVNEYIAQEAEEIQELNETFIKTAGAYMQRLNRVNAMKAGAKYTSISTPLLTKDELMEIVQAAKKSNKGLQCLKKAKKGGKRSQKSKK